MGRGLIHIYCGDGKGKTTAAIGLAVRAAGRGRRVLLLRLMKDSNSGELAALEKLPGVRVMPAPERVKFVFAMSADEKREYGETVRGLWRAAVAEAEAGEWDLLVVDELCSAVSCGFLPRDEVLRFMRGKPEPLELVLTGRDPCPEFVDAADYVSEIRKLKHPFDGGVGAREGIEF